MGFEAVQSTGPHVAAEPYTGLMTDEELIRQPSRRTAMPRSLWS